jgi:hypothetical protein
MVTRGRYHAMFPHHLKISNAAQIQFGDMEKLFVLSINEQKLVRLDQSTESRRDF